MSEWTKDQQDEFTGLYTQYKKLPYYNEGKANNILFSSQLPYNEAKSRLQKLIDEGQKQESGLESKVKAQPSSVFERIGSLFSKPAVAASATALLLLYLGLPPVY